MSSFAFLDMNKALLENLESLGYLTMTPVQEQSLPAILSGGDVIGQAKTGSGKTAAFGLGILNQLDIANFTVQALILCPTRELADQVADEIRKLARAIPNVKVLTLCGGKPIRAQVDSLAHGAHIVVGTPGRIEAHLRKSNLVLHQLKLFVLDEADRMLDMGFQEDLEKIVGFLPDRRQTLLFSATFSEEMRAVSAKVTDKPTTVTIEEHHDATSIRQSFHLIDTATPRQMALKLLLLKHAPESALVFCSTRVETQDVADELRASGFSVLALHGEMDQQKRDQTMVLFANKSVSVLVATDVAARGLDVQELDLVINYHLAQDVDVHVHRVGRTGRAGSSGLACTLFKANQQYKLDALSEAMGVDISPSALPPGRLIKERPQRAKMVTLRIDGGKKQKVRPGDILGALTGKDGIAGTQVGKISVLATRAYVAVAKDAAKPALRKLSTGKLKGRTFRVRRLNP